jgi:single-strand DNA-binding protein
MKGIACAFEGRLGRDAEIKTAKTSGRQFVTLSVIEGQDDEAQWLNVVAWSESLAEIAGNLTKGTELYIEGKLTLRSWESETGTRYGLSVSASLVQPMALIGRSKPKTPRTPTRKTSAVKSRPDSQAPMAFADGTDMDRGDALPF